MQYLANGRLIFSHGLYTNLCGYNYAPHACQQAYLHEWFVSIITYTTYLLGHWNGLQLLQIATIVAIFLVVAYLAKKNRYSLFSTAIFMFLAILVGMERFMLRADLFALLLAVLFYALVRDYIENKSYEQKGWRRYLPLILLFIVQVLWTNTHGSFVLAFVIAGAYIGAYVIQYLLEVFVHEKEDVTFFEGPVKAICTVLLVTVVASVINPFGIGALVNLNASTAINTTIGEWQSPFAPAEVHALSQTIFAITLCIAALVLLANIKKLYLPDVIVLLVFGYLSVRYRRFLTLFVVFCVPILPYYLDNIRNYSRQFFGSTGKLQIVRSIAVGEIAVMLVLAGISLYLIQDIVTNKFYPQDHRTRIFGSGLSEIAYPVGAATFIEQSNLAGNMFNNYNTGTYLNWRLYPARKTFIDGYTFSTDWKDNYDRVMSGVVNYNEVAQKYHINYFLLDYEDGDTYWLLQTLAKDKKWKLVYFDEMTVIFVANTPENQAIIKTQSGKSYYPDRLPTFTDPADFEKGFLNRGDLFNSLGLSAYAVNQLQKAIALKPNDYHPYAGLGVAYAMQGKNELAEEPFKKAIELAPDITGNYYRLGLYYDGLGSYDEALPEFKKTLSMDSQYPNANLNVGLIYLKKGDKANAKIYVQREIQINSPYSSEAQKVMQKYLSQ